MFYILCVPAAPGGLGCPEGSRGHKTRQRHVREHEGSATQGQVD